MKKLLKKLKNIFRPKVDHTFDFAKQAEDHRNFLKNRDGQIDYEVFPWKTEN